jgi:hypothetical protein
MKQITLRSIPEKVKKKIKKEAERKGVSMNKAIISLLEKAGEDKRWTRRKKRSITTLITWPASGLGKKPPFSTKA